MFDIPQYVENFRRILKLGSALDPQCCGSGCDVVIGASNQAICGVQQNILRYHNMRMGPMV